MNVSPKKIYEQLGVPREQLDMWEEAGSISVTRTQGGHRRYNVDEISRLAKASVKTGEPPQKRDVYQEYGTTGIRRFGGSVVEERLNELRGANGRRLYREMRTNDPVISAIFFAIVNSLRQASWRVEPASEAAPDRDAAAFIESCMHDCTWSWHDQLTFIFDPMLEQGFSALEIVYKRRLGDTPPSYIKDPAGSMFDDGRIGWRKWAPRSAESLAPGNEWIFDKKNGTLQGLNQQIQSDGPLGKTQTIQIGMEKLLLFRTTVHPNNNPEGMPIHRAMYLPWWFSTQLMEIEGIAVERTLTGIPVMYLGSDCTREGSYSDYTMAKDLVTNIRLDEQTGVVLPRAKMGSGAAEGQGILLELLSPKAGAESSVGSVGAILERYDKRKAVSVLAQFILLGMDRIGSFALSKNQSDLFVLAVRAVLLSAADVINRHAVPRLMALNTFTNTMGNPKLVPGTLGIPDLATISNYVNRLVDKEVLTPDSELERHLRQVGGLPEASLEVSSPRRDTAGEHGDDQEEDVFNRSSEDVLKILQRVNDLRDSEAAAYVKDFSRIEKQDPSGLDIERDLHDEIALAWEEMQEEIEKIDPDDPDREMEMAALLLLLRNRIEKATRAAYTDAWVEGADIYVESQVEDAIQQAMDYFDNFTRDLRLELNGLDNVEAIEKMERRKSRALMYAGGAWALYNLAKVYGRSNNELWQWEGPIDGNSCACCIIEVTAGPRPLRAVTHLPGECSCLTRCRHEVVRA